MKTVVLRLEGPLQAWATQSRFGIRDTDREPSKSGVLGVIAAALGMERDDDALLASLAKLELAVRVDRPGSLLRDYHTAGGGTFRGGRKYFVHGTSDCVPTQRYLLQDASFSAALGGEDDLVDKVAIALRSPHWPLFLGRRACVPSVPVLLQVVAIAPRVAIREAPLADRAEGRRFRLVCDAQANEAGDARIDVPLSFREGSRRYAHRTVITDWLEVREPVGPARDGLMDGVSP